MNLFNRTHLVSTRLEDMFSKALVGWPLEKLDVFVRYSRGADFSGVCYYNRHRIHINLGKHNCYPYRLKTYIARPQSNATHWWRELYAINVADAYQLALFIFLHEYYHWLIRSARRNVRQKEGRCDRFATRVLVDQYAAVVVDEQNRPVLRGDWDFQDLEGFVAAAKKTRRKTG